MAAADAPHLTPLGWRLRARRSIGLDDPNLQPTNACIAEGDWTDALDMPAAQVAVADYCPNWWPAATRLLIRRVRLDVTAGQVSADPRARRGVLAFGELDRGAADARPLRLPDYDQRGDEQEQRDQRRSDGHGPSLTASATRAGKGRNTAVLMIATMIATLSTTHSR